MFGVRNKRRVQLCLAHEINVMYNYVWRTKQTSCTTMFGARNKRQDLNYSTKSVSGKYNVTTVHLWSFHLQVITPDYKLKAVFSD